MAEAEQIEVGEAAEGVRYWRAKEAVRQAEAKLASQATSLAAMEARATSLTGWAVAGATAMASALTVATLQPVAVWAATGALVTFVLAATSNAAVLFPGRWTAFGDPSGLLSSEEPNELVELEVMAAGLAEGIGRNGQRLNKAGNLLALGIILLALAPAVGAICGVAQGFIPSWGASVEAPSGGSSAHRAGATVPPKNTPSLIFEEETRASCRAAAAQASSAEECL